MVKIEEIDNPAIYYIDGNPITLSAFDSNENYPYEWEDANVQIISTMPEAEVASGGTYSEHFSLIR